MRSMRFGRLKLALGVLVAVIGLALAACGASTGGSQPGASPSTSSHSGWS